MYRELPSIAAADVPDDAYVVDVREHDEWSAGHPPGAHHVPMMEIPARLAEVPREGDVVIACRVGARSGQVAAFLAARGWDNVRNLDGGMYAWVAAGRPLVSEDGRAPAVI